MSGRRRGIFNGTISVTNGPKGDELRVHLSGTFDAIGAGEALGMVARGFIGSMPAGRERNELFHDLVVAFIANAAQGEIVLEAGSSEVINLDMLKTSEGKPS